jgi:CheY-like chemotaxis protein
LALLKVLIADDSLVITELLAEQVRSFPGIELAGVANDGDQALQMIYELKPNLVLLDISMPRRNGIEVLKEVRTYDSSTIFIMFTADNSQTVREACLQAGADHYIVKTQFDDLVKVFELYV